MSKTLKKIIFAVIIILAVGFVLFEFKLIPEKLNLDKFFSGSAKLTWNASDDASVVGYKIYYGTTARTADCPPGGYEKNIDAEKNVNYTLTGLETGKTYYFSVTSYNSARKESCFSAEMKKAVPSSIFARFKAFFGPS